jgi:hypothetical protein
MSEVAFVSFCVTKTSIFYPKGKFPPGQENAQIRILIFESRKMASTHFEGNTARTGV